MDIHTGSRNIHGFSPYVDAAQNLSGKYITIEV